MAGFRSADRERFLAKVAARAVALVPAVVVAVLLASGGGVLAWAWTAGLAAATVLSIPALVLVAAGRTRPRMFGAAELALPGFLVVYAATGLAGSYPGAAVPALLHAGLAAAVFRAAAAAAQAPDGARRQAVALVGVAAAAAAIAIVTSLAGGGPAHVHAAAPFVARGHLAAFLAASLPLAVALAADRWPVRALPARVPVAAARGALALVVVAIAFTVARAGIAVAGAVLLASVSALVRLPRREEPLPPRLVTAAAVVVLPATALWIALGPIGARLAAGSLRDSAVERADILRAAWATFLERPLVGHGAGGFEHAFLPARPPGVPYLVDHAHCDLLELAVESGIAGLLAAAVAAVLLARTLLAARASPLARLTAAALLGLGALALEGLVDFPMRLGAIAALAAWLLGIAAGSAGIRAAGRRIYGPDPGDPPAPGGTRAAAALAALVLVALTGVGIAQSAAAALSRGDETARMRATRLAPWNAGVWRAAAEAALERGLAGEPAAFADAAARFDAALARHPADAPSLAGRGRLRMLEGDADAALALFARAVAADPLHPSWRIAQVTALARAGRPAEAREAAAAAIAHRPALAGSVLPAAVDALGATEAPALAEALPADADALAVLGRLLLERGLREEALRAADRAAGLEPERHAASAAEIALSRGDAAGAAERLDRALAALGVACPPSGIAPRAALTLLLRRARMDVPGPFADGKAGACAIALFPGESAAWMLAAEQAAAAGDAAGAEASWRQAAELAPSDPGALIALSRHLAPRDWKAALSVARDAELRATCGGAGAREVLRLLEANGLTAAAAVHVEELRARCPDAGWLPAASGQP